MYNNIIICDKTVLYKYYNIFNKLLNFNYAVSYYKLKYNLL